MRRGIPSLNWLRVFEAAAKNFRDWLLEQTVNVNGKP